MPPEASIKVLCGSRFGSMTVVHLLQEKPVKNYDKFAFCRCDCGNTKYIRLRHLRSGAVLSCGCHRENLRKTHGGSYTNEYKIWQGMLIRCRNPRFVQYQDYGGRGIRVCERWLSFENFLADLGKRPSKQHSIERIDNDGNYEPANCKWATKLEQSANSRRNRFITAFNRTQHLRAWAREFDIDPKTLQSRIDSGIKPELALTAPIFKTRGLERAHS